MLCCPYYLVLLLGHERWLEIYHYTCLSMGQSEQSWIGSFFLIGLWVLHLTRSIFLPRFAHCSPKHDNSRRQCRHAWWTTLKRDLGTMSQKFSLPPNVGLSEWKQQVWGTKRHNSHICAHLTCSLANLVKDRQSNFSAIRTDEHTKCCFKYISYI